MDPCRGNSGSLPAQRPSSLPAAGQEDSAKEERPVEIGVRHATASAAIPFLESELSSYLMFTPTFIRKLIRLGYEDTKRQEEDLLAFFTAEGPGATN